MSYTGSALLRWGMNSESDMAGYRIYKGTASLIYTAFSSGGNYIDVGLSGIGGSTDAPAAYVPDLPNGIQAYLAITAYDNSGNESTFSTELSYAKTVPLLSLLRSVR